MANNGEVPTREEQLDGVIDSMLGQEWIDEERMKLYEWIHVSWTTVKEIDWVKHRVFTDYASI